MVINIKITDKRPRVEGAPVIVCGNSDYSINFTFDTEWDAHNTKTVRFVWIAKGKVRFKDVEMTGTTTCKVPKLRSTNSVRVGVYAGDLCTTTPAAIPCERSILCEEGKPATEDYQYYANEAMDAANEAKDAANEAKKYAEEAINAAAEVVRGGEIFANALKGKKSGGIVLMSDISPCEHTLDVKVTGANVGAVKVKKLGKNLINPTDYLASSASTTLDGHVFTTSFSSGALFFNSKRQNSIKAGTYTVTITPVDCTMHFSLFCYSATDTTFTSFLTQYKGNISTPWSFTFTADTDFVFSLGGLSPSSGGGYGTFNYTVQIEAGTASAGTEFEPYIEPVEYAVNEDGTVEGVLPIYPSTTLMTDTVGAVIDVEYNRDINKAFAELYNAMISLGGNV